MEFSNQKIAVLILAHTNFRQLLRLCSHLADDFDVYIHLDKASSLTPEQFTGNPRISAIKQLRIHWGTQSIVLAQLKLMAMAEEKSGGYDRYILISGQDVPLKKNLEIRRHFEGHTELDFLDCSKLIADHPFVHRIAQWHWKPAYRSRGVIRLVKTGVAETLRVLQRLLPPRRNDFDFYLGSNWMDLTGKTVRQVLQLVGNTPEFLARFKHTLIPEEMFFQTATHFLGIGTCGKSENKRYIDWETGQASPRTLRIEDLGAISLSDALFARKLDEKVDLELIDALYARLA